MQKFNVYFEFKNGKELNLDISMSSWRDLEDFTNRMIESESEWISIDAFKSGKKQKFIISRQDISRIVLSETEN